MEDRNNNKGKSEIYSKAVRAGKRTYFFDVKATRDENLYITVTESKKRFRNDGGFFYEKHKLFLYKEDFIKFAEGLNEVVEYVRKNNPTPVEEQTYSGPDAQEEVTIAETDSVNSNYTDVDFDDLGN